MYQVVLVDDEPVVLEGLRHAIDWEGYSFEIVCATTNPLEALDYIQSNKINLLITDISMPQMNGLDLVKKVKQIDSLIFVLILSAYNQFDLVKTALRYGSENYMLKPIDSNELTDSLRQILGTINERQQISSTYKNAMLSFRSNFTENWVTNNLSSNDFITKSELLGINIHANDFSVIIFVVTDNDSKKMLAFFDIFLSALPGKYLAHFYFETPTRLTCILSSLDPHQYIIEELIKDVLSESTTYGIPIFAAIGKTVLNYHEVHISYQNAKLMLFLSYVHPVHTLQCSYEKLDINTQLSNVLLESLTLEDHDICTLVITKYFDLPSVQKQPKAYTIVLISSLLSQLHTNIDYIFSSFPLLKQEIQNFLSLTDYHSYMHFTLNFSKVCTHSKHTLNYSMYPCVDMVLKAIHEFNDKEISLKTLSAKLNITPSYLGMIFKQQTGYYFNDYLSEARLIYASNLLVNTDMKIKDIVEKVGFSSSTYFNRNFKRYFNTSPVSYRREKRNLSSNL